MRNGKKKSLHEHLLAIGLAVVIVAAVSIGVNQSGMLTADVLRGTSGSAAAAGDISYAIEQGALAVVSQKEFTDAQSLTFHLVYNPDSVQPDEKAIETSFDYTSSSGKDGVIQVTVFVPSSVAMGITLVKVPFTGNPDEITIADANMQFAGGNTDGLAIKKQ